MAKYRNDLPQLSGAYSGIMFLTDSGLETDLIFNKGFDLPEFAAFPLLDNEEGRRALSDYYGAHAALAQKHGMGFVLESPTWRANPEYGPRVGYEGEKLAAANRAAIDLMVEIRNAFETPDTPMPISGQIGPRGDGYQPGALMTADEAEDYHSVQINMFRDSEADMVTALTLNYADEAIGYVRAAGAAGIPAVVAFTLETDGRLPTGQSLGEAITEVDEATNAADGGGPAYYMINCAHPTHFAAVLDGEAPWASRVRGLRPNASKMSHAELDNAEELDEGNPGELAAEVMEIVGRLGSISVLGGCCGTDLRHISAISAAIGATTDE